MFIVAVKMPDRRYHTSATHAAEPLCHRTLSGAVPLNRYEKSDNVNLRYQNTATGGTKSPILSTKAIDSFIAKVRDIKFKAKVDDADIEKLTDDRKKLIGDESKLLEDHRKENKEILTRHFYDMSNMMSRNEGVWLSNGWVKTLLWIFLPCFLYTVISLVYFVASYIDK